MKLGIVGSGFIAGVVIPVLKEIGIDIRAVCGTPRSAEKVRDLCREHGIPQGFTDLNGLLSSDVDTVYIAVPNSLHCEMTKACLSAGKHVIVEKPFASNLHEAKEMADLAVSSGKFLLEAISTLYLPDYRKARELLPKIGRIRLVNCNYSQYSSRYGLFVNGEIKPAFDPGKSGGALMDINVYNIHFIVGLFGAPKRVHYLPNIDRGIDTSGILTLEYEDFCAVAVGAKDCGGDSFTQIQGTEGYMIHRSPANSCEKLTVVMNGGGEEHFHEETIHRLAPEFVEFERIIGSGDAEACMKMLEHSLSVMEVLDEARRSAGIRFPADG